MSSSIAKEDTAGRETSLPSTMQRIVAVIDIGATAIRMAVAEIHVGGKVRMLDQLVQPVQLGQEAFETRRLSRKSIERVVSVLSQYQRVLREYGIEGTSDIRVVATSAVREASNRLAFADRVYTVTGLHVEPIDEAEVNRITYMGITPQLLANADLSNGKAMVLEVGGGSTEVLIVRSGNVLASNSFRLGSLRMLQAIDLARAGGRMRVDADAAAGIPVLSLVDGEIEVIATASDVDACADAMAGVARAWGTGLRAAVGTADRDTAELADALEASLATADEIVEVVRYRIGPSVGAHTGPGTAGAFFWPAAT